MQCHVPHRLIGCLSSRVVSTESMSSQLFPKVLSAAKEAEDVALLSDQCHGNWTCERGEEGLDMPGWQLLQVSTHPTRLWNPRT